MYRALADGQASAKVACSRMHLLLRSLTRPLFFLFYYFCSFPLFSLPLSPLPPLPFLFVSLGWHFLYFIAPIPKAMIPLAVHQFFCEGVSCPTIYSQQLGRTVSKWEYVRTYLATGHEWQWYYVGWLFFSIFVLRLLIAIVVQKVSHQSR